MMQILTHIIAFSIGGFLGVAFMCAFAISHRS